MGEAPPYDAVMVTAVETLTGVGLMVNVANVAPAATVTFGGTVAVVVSELERVTTAPPAGAGPFRLTRFAVDGLPPATIAGDSVTDAATIGFSVSVAVLFTPA